MKWILPVFIAGILVFGCAASEEKTVVLVGGEREKHKIDCSGLTNTWEECYLEADEICGEKGYQVLTRSDDGGQVGRRETGWYDSDDVIRKLRIKCVE